MTFADPGNLDTLDVFPEAWADQVRANFLAMSTWGTYTPTWTQSATVSNTVNIANYIQLADLVICQVRLTATSAGTGNNVLRVTLPVTAAASYATGMVIGNGAVDDASVGTYGATVVIGNTTSVAQFIRQDTTTISSFIGQDPNFAVASTDSVRFVCMYQAA